MKCIKCGIDNQFQDRINNLGSCTNCGHDFVFEPKIMLSKVTITDVFFAKLIIELSANETLFFTPSQLYYLLNKRLQKYVNKINWITVFLFALFILVALIANIDKGRIVETIIVLIIGVGGIVAFSSKHRKKRKFTDPLVIDRVQFDRWLARWNSINNPPDKILSAPQFSNLSAAPNPEVTAYSFDRVIVCDTPEIAQLLISNNFHFENNCAILTIDGYPQSIFTTTMEMLRRNPDLKVYALHNCSPSGIQIVHRLRQDDNWFPDLKIPIVDVGILPRQIIDNLDLLTLQSAESAESARQLSPELRNNLNPAELAWLDAGYYLELESFSPKKLIRILQRAISESRSLVTIEDDERGIINASDFYTVDSFG